MEKEIIRYPRIHGVSFSQDDIPTVFPPHWHNAAEFIVILKKGCKYRIDGKFYEPEPGDILLVWPRELHELLHTPQGSVAFIQFSSYLIESNSDFASASHFINECHLIKKGENPELTAKIEGLIYKIRDAVNQNIYFAETRCKVLVYEILLLIGDFVMKEHCQSLGGVHFSDRLWEYVRYACSYISEHSSENITQAEVAQKTGLSPYYFSKIFNEYTKMRFPEYLAGIRVQNAINLLENESISVTDCAFKSGFQSTTTFNKVFHEQTGCSPREYRKFLSQNKRM
ncbi:MAG: AraC family transcriptional regulator [Treponema sp.]|nr:AraC family transcriptional regulator [Treponema sp.]